MNLSLVPIYVVIVFIFCVFITVRAHKNQSLTTKEACSVYLLLTGFALWTVASIVMGLHGIHLQWMDHIPFLWQANVAVVMLAVGLFFKSLRHAIYKLAVATPGPWLASIQILRIGALGAILKGLRGEVTSTFVYWVGIPDFLFGLSAIPVAWLVYKQSAARWFLIAWNLTGIAIILIPLYTLMPYWMKEPGFSFIFEFPMILSPSIVVPILVCINFLKALKVYHTQP